MTTTPKAATERTRNLSHKTIAKHAGYYIREGSFLNTTDDRLGRWYIGNSRDEFFRPWGAGYPSQKAAWEAAYRAATRWYVEAE